MTRMKSTLFILAFVAVTWGTTNPVRAQSMPGVNPPGTTALEDAGGGAVRGRSPGNMVQEGVARHQEFTDFDFGITEEPAPSPRAAALVEVFSTLFEELNAAIEAFTALLIARSGGNPFTSSSLVSGFLNNNS